MTPPTPGAMRAAEEINAREISMTSELVHTIARIIDAETGKDREELVGALKKIAALDNYSRAESLESQIGEPVGYGEALGRIEAATIAKAALKALGEEVGGG